MSGRQRPRRGAAIAADEQRRQLMAEINNDNTPRRGPKRPRNADNTSQAKKPKVNKRPPTINPAIIKDYYLQFAYNQLYRRDREKFAKNDQINYDAAFGMFFEILRLIDATAYGRRYREIVRDESKINNDIILLYNEFIKNNPIKKFNASKQTLNINFKTQEELTEFYFFKYLDSIHDGIVPDRTTFNNYIDKFSWEIPSKLISEIKAVKLNTPVIKRVSEIKSIGIVFDFDKGDCEARRYKFEAYIKNALISIFPKPTKNSLLRCTQTTNLRNFIDSNSRLNNSALSPNRSIGICIDMEVDQALSQFTLINAMSGIVRNKVNVSNLMDPGRYKQAGLGAAANTAIAMKFIASVNQRVSPNNTFGSQTNKNPFFINQYTCKHFTTEYSYKGETPFLKTASSTDIKVSKRNNSGSFVVNIDRSALRLTLTNHMGKSIDVTPDAKGAVQMNNISRPSAEEFCQNVNIAFQGDFQQKTIVTTINKSRTRGEGFQFNATGDGAFCGCIVNLDNILDRQSQLIVDQSIQGGRIDIYGLSSGIVDLSTIQFQQPSMSVTTGTRLAIGGNNNNNNTAQSMAPNLFGRRAPAPKTQKGVRRR